MKFLLVFLLVGLSWTFVCSRKLKPLSDDEIEYINSVQTSWRAGRNFDENQLAHAKRLMGTNLESLHLRKKRFNQPSPAINIEDYPASFDARQQWPDCETMKDIRDQGDCGSCWAFGAAEAISDRICVHSKKNVLISAEDILACCGNCGFGCNGGDPMAAWEYFDNNGTVTGGQYGTKKGCMPYTIAHCSHHISGKYPNCTDPMVPTPKCVPKCIAGYPNTYEKDKHFGHATEMGAGADLMMKQVYEGGPVTVAFAVYSDFLSYKSGVYKHVTGSELGGHAVKVLGWGVENGEDYWLVANSWNEEWGDKGYFKISRGNDECGIEDYIVYGTWN